MQQHEEKLSAAFCLDFEWLSDYIFLTWSSVHFLRNGVDDTERSCFRLFLFAHGFMITVSFKSMGQIPRGHESSYDEWIWMVYSVYSWCYSFHKFSLNMINMINMSLKNTKKSDLKMFISCLKTSFISCFLSISLWHFRGHGCHHGLVPKSQRRRRTPRHLGVLRVFRMGGHSDHSGIFFNFQIIGKYMKSHEISMLRIQDDTRWWFHVVPK